MALHHSYLLSFLSVALAFEALGLRIEPATEKINQAASKTGLVGGAERFTFGEAVEASVDAEEMIQLKNWLQRSGVDISEFLETELDFGLGSEVERGPRDGTDSDGVGSKQLHFHPHFKAMWHVAAKENNISARNTSEFARRTIKYHKEWVERINDLHAHVGGQKQCNYFFSGRTYEPGKEGRRRSWVIPFFRQLGGPRDVFKTTTVPARKPYQPLGVWDKTLEEERGWKPRHGGSDPIPFDDSYYNNMAKSRFTLAPGGAHSYSFRFWEAISVKSVPLMYSVSNDFGSDVPPFLREIGFNSGVFLQQDKQWEYNDHLVEANFQKWYQYMTFEMGDLTPSMEKEQSPDTSLTDHVIWMS